MSDLIRRTRRAYMEERHDRRDRAQARRSVRQLQALQEQADLEVEAIRLTGEISQERAETLADVFVSSANAMQLVAAVGDMVVYNQPSAVSGIGQLTTAVQIGLVQNVHTTRRELSR